MKSKRGYLCLAVLSLTLCMGCAGNENKKNREAVSEAAVTELSVTEASEKEDPVTEAAEESAGTAVSEEGFEEAAAQLEDGVYTAEFHTDSSMFHVNEACDGKGILTVEDGEMTIHISLTSKNIVNLYPGLAEDAGKESARILEPVVDTVTYEDGISEEVNGFDIPVPVLDEEFDLALIGTKGVWYDHKVSVSNPEKTE
ncbi:MAG: hypothetical protein PUB22_08265 [Clostridiales bacterium]|nr:hypothetical protein [Clostridiales bacterium]